MNLMRFFRYIVTGLTANGLGLAVFQALVWAGAAPELASFLATFPAVLTAYLLNKLWSFKSALPHRRVILRYGLTTVAMMVLQIAIVSVLYRLLGVWPLVAQLIALGIATPISYLLMTFWVFAAAHVDPAVAKSPDTTRPHL
jgi:putative flippase GtrA